MKSDKEVVKSEDNNLEKWHEDLNRAQLQLVKNIFFYQNVMKSGEDENEIGQLKVEQPKRVPKKEGKKEVKKK